MIPFVIARNTFREATRDRAVAGMIVAGLVLLGATQILSPIALGEGRRLTVDLGLSGISMLGLLTVLLVGTSLVSKEVERKTIYNLLSRPISRRSYLVGKWMGLSAALWVLAAALGLALWLVMTARGYADHGPAIAQAVYLAGLELSVVTAVAVLFSSLSTPILSSLYTLGLYVVGQWSFDLRALAAQLPSQVATLMGAMADVVPNLPIFNMRSLAASGMTASAEHVLIASLYALLYCGAALTIATAAFETRDFK